MALRNAILAALLEGEASGYDLAKTFGASVGNFWRATSQQLYRELDRMESEGLVRARVVQQERRPNKRLFSLTEPGRQVLYAFTAGPPRPTAIRDELLVQVQAVDTGDDEAVRKALGARVDAARDKLARYDRRRERLLDGRTEPEFLAAADRIGPYLTLMRGRAFEEENIRWGEQALAVLEQRAAAERG